MLVNQIWLKVNRSIVFVDCCHDFSLLLYIQKRALPAAEVDDPDEDIDSIMLEQKNDVKRSQMFVYLFITVLHSYIFFVSNIFHPGEEY